MTLKLKDIQKLVIDEVDEMLNLGFKPQLTTLLDLLPKKRQNILFSATTTPEVDTLLSEFFKSPVKITAGASGSPLDTIEQQAFPVPNLYTKINFLVHLLKDTETFHKVLVFVKNKKHANAPNILTVGRFTTLQKSRMPGRISPYPAAIIS